MKNKIINIHLLNEELESEIVSKMSSLFGGDIKSLMDKKGSGQKFTAQDFINFFKDDPKKQEIVKDLEKSEDEDVEEISTSDVDKNWMTITKKVIDKLEGGYWNPKCKHPSSGMGKSTETMFGLDRYNGNIESTPEGREFFRIIDKDKKDLGMSGFCKKWKWLYRGGDKEGVLKDLAAKIMKRAFDRNMNNFVKSSETRKKILGSKNLLLHMSYASWNGPGFFQKFARSLEKGVKDGLSTKELIDLAIQDRSNTALANKNKTAAVIKNPDL